MIGRPENSSLNLILNVRNWQTLTLRVYSCCSGQPFSVACQISLPVLVTFNVPDGRRTCRQRPQRSPTDQQVKVVEFWGSCQQVRHRSVPQDCQPQSWCAHSICSRQLLHCSHCSVHIVVTWGGRLLWSLSYDATIRHHLSVLSTIASLLDICWYSGNDTIRYDSEV